MVVLKSVQTGKPVKPTVSSFSQLFRDSTHLKAGQLVFACIWFIFAGHGCVIPQITRYFDMDLHLSDHQIGILMGIPALLTLLIQPLLGIAADGIFGRTVTLRMLILFSAFFLGIFNFAYPLGGFFLLLTTACLFMSCMQSTNPLSASIILSLLGREKRQYFGRIRVAGSISFTVSVFLFGPPLVLLSQYLGWDKRNAVFLTGSIFFLIAFLCTFWDEKQFETHHKPKLDSFRIILKNGNLLRFFLSVYIVYIGASAGIQYIGPYLGHAGMSEWFFSSWWLAGISVEIILNYNLAHVIRFFGLKRTIVLGMAADGLRWILYSFIASPPLILLINGMHGIFVIGNLFANAIYMDVECSESIRSTAQAFLYFAMVAGQITGYIGGSLIVNAYHFLPRAEAIQSGFFWFGLTGITAAIFCKFFVK